MTDPMRWTDDGEVPDGLRAMVVAAREPEVDSAAVQRIRDGVERGVTSGSSGAAKAGAAAVVVALAVGVPWALSSAPPPGTRAPAPAVVASSDPERAPAAAEVPAATPVEAPDSVPEAEVETAADVGAAQTPPRGRTRPKAKAEPASAADEAKLLLRARRLLPKDPSAALALTREHARDYRSGNLVQERELLAIRALVATGDVSAARKRLVRFERRFPESAHLAAARAAVTVASE